VNRIKTPGVSGAQLLVAPALPVMARELRVSTGGISWVLTAYLLAASPAGSCCCRAR
jgi:predicted MFS family arabinose efflux permease